ncbi:hypothetical protein [Psychroserpens luteolus]|uniref:hypothetical protein n=1 Tax=Psychroserpens luteolus TaxID=2855840 RepID=UPI001E644B2A|nr:hypothetical protein [Psychroserpens luteolus]MCD2259540.1 hypothetical protein [Psychroserpens luteolus]
MYQSIVDQLKISVEDLLDIDEIKIIRFEKIVKSQTMLNDAHFKNEENHSIIDILRDPEKRKFIYIIEKHPRLKSFLSNDKPLESQTLTIDRDVIDSLNIDDTAFRKFINPYLNAILIPKLKNAINSNQFFYALDKIKNDWLFSEDIKFQCQNILRHKIVTTIHLLKTKQQIKAIKYTKSNSFGALIAYCASNNGLDVTKEYLEILVKQLKKVHSRTKIADHYHKSLIAVHNSKLDNEAINRYVESHINNHISCVILDKKTSNEWGMQLLLTIAVLLITVVGATIFNHFNEKKQVEPYSLKDVNNFYTAFNSLYGPHITRDANGVLKNIEGQLIMKAYKYPYDINSELTNSIFFPFYKSFPEVSSSSQHKLTIENLDRDKSLIVFRKNNYNHCALLRPRSKITTFVEPKDSLIFYRGKFLNISDYGGLSTFNGIYKHSSKADRLRFFNVYVVHSQHQSDHALIQMKDFGELKFQDIKTTEHRTSYVGKNIIDINILDTYLD